MTDADGSLSKRLSARLNSPSSSVGFVEHATATPLALPRRRIQPARANRLIRDFQRILVQRWLEESWPAELIAPAWRTPGSVELLRNVDPTWLIPTFVRTDESLAGSIFEIQSPGGWWGTIDALEQEVRTPSTLAERSAAELEALLPNGVRILYLFDSAGLWHENVYFADRLRTVSEQIRVCGLDPDTWPSEATFVRAHAFRPLIAEDRFAERLESFVAGHLRFDHPPLPIFDQKLPMCLPFHPATRDWFGDDHRALFPYTVLVQEGSAELPDGTDVTVEELARSGQQAAAGWFLKYAGTDPARNHSAIGVYALGGLAAEEWAALKDLLGVDAERGEPWLLQQSVDTSMNDEFEGQQDPSSLKVSIFHGPSGPLGGMFLSRPEITVHGGGSALVGLVTGWES